MTYKINVWNHIMKTYYEHILWKHPYSRECEQPSERITLMCYTHAVTSSTFPCAIVLKAVPSTLLFFIRHGQAQSARPPELYPHGPQCNFAFCVWFSKCLMWPRVNSCFHWHDYSLDVSGSVWCVWLSECLMTPKLPPKESLLSFSVPARKAG